MATTRPRMEGALSLGSDGGETMASAGDYADVIGKLPESTISIYVDQRALKEAAERAAAADSAAGVPDAQSERATMIITGVATQIVPSEKGLRRLKAMM